MYIHVYNFAFLTKKSKITLVFITAAVVTPQIKTALIYSQTKM